MRIWIPSFLIAAIGFFCFWPGAAAVSRVRLVDTPMQPWNLK